MGRTSTLPSVTDDATGGIISEVRTASLGGRGVTMTDDDPLLVLTTSSRSSMAAAEPIELVRLTVTDGGDDVNSALDEGAKEMGIWRAGWPAIAGVTVTAELGNESVAWGLLFTTGVKVVCCGKDVTVLGKAVAKILLTLPPSVVK